MILELVIAMTRNYAVVLKFFDGYIQVIVRAKSLVEAETKVLAIKPGKLLKLWFEQNPPSVVMISTADEEPVTKL
jgi:hypothetical protein